jgi:aminoglycoside phosphotransferase (APT) family kinase protein
VLALHDLDLATAADRMLAREHDDIAAWLRRMESRTARQPLPVVGRHGHFLPRNIYVGERRVSVTDFSTFREGLPLEDVAQFLVQLEILMSDPLQRRAPALPRFFLEGYTAGESVDEETLCFFMAMAALECLSRGGDAELGKLERASRHRALRRLILRGVS